MSERLPESLSETSGISTLTSGIQKHFISLFLLRERPLGWKIGLFEHMNLLHRNSFYLGNINSAIEDEVENSFITKSGTLNLRSLQGIVVAKHQTAPKKSKKKLEKIPKGMMLNDKNRIPIDVILSITKKQKLL